MRRVAITVILFALGACKSSGDATDGSGSGGSGDASISGGTVSDGSGGMSGTVSGGSATGDGGSGAGTTASSGDGTASDTGTADGSTGSVDIPSDPADCDGKYYACGDGIDNDGDGLVDLADKECTGPCDDDEASFQTGLPGDNVDCKQDCFFDGNSGAGDDGCNWDLTCDPSNPGANIGCEYTGGNNCNNSAEQTQQCIDVCGSYTPPGCDCFGCCRVETGDGSTVDIFLNSGPDCSLDNLEACNTCTYQADTCGNECDPDPTSCELCFGQDPSELPPECEGSNDCGDSTACGSNADCPDNWYCSVGCCYPPPS